MNEIKENIAKKWAGTPAHSVWLDLHSVSRGERNTVAAWDKEIAAIHAALARARAEERERCVKVCEFMAAQLSYAPGRAAEGARAALLDAADRIRALDDERTEK